MINRNYNDNDSEEKVTMIKNNKFFEQAGFIVSGLQVCIGE